MILAVFRKRIADRWWAAVVGAALTMALGAVLFGWRDLSNRADITHGLRAFSFDFPFAFAPIRRPPEVIIVALDQVSYSQLGQSETNTWDRALHVELLRRVVALGADAVVFDIWFDQPWSDPVVDERFAQAIRESAGKVVLASYALEKIEGGIRRWEELPPTSVLAAVAPRGIVQLPLAPDGVVRLHSTNELYRALSWRVAESLGRPPPDSAEPRWLNFYGPRGTLDHRSYSEVLRGNQTFPPGYFSGKVIFVGRGSIVTSQGVSQEDEHRTPYTRWQGSTLAGVEVQATAFLNLWRQEWLTEVSRRGCYTIFAGLGLLLGFCLPLLRPWAAMAIGSCAAIGAGVAACGLVWSERYWLPWVIFSGVQAPFAMMWAVIAHTRWLLRENKSLEHRLATSLAAGPSLEGVTPRRPVVPDHILGPCIGRGAYGEVWLARDLVGSVRAVKVIHRDRFPNEEPFDREFRGIQKYSPISRTHPGWVDVLHIGRLEADGGFFYIMEAGDDAKTGQSIDFEHYVARTLAEDIRRQVSLPLKECLDISVALADALVHLHRHGLIHRDIKPANVIFVGGAPKFADIGLVTQSNELGRDASFLGTEGFIAPEGPGTPMADIFSFGRLIYEISSGRNCRAFPELPTSLTDDVPDPLMEELYRITLKACEPDVRYRYPNAEALQNDLIQLRDRLSETPEE